MGHTRLNVGIAGMGVAGLAVAALLARAGAQVVAYDKLARAAPVGSGLIVQPVGLAVLEELGAAGRVRTSGARIERLHGRAVPSGRVVLDVRYDALGPGAPCGTAVHRGALFQALFEAALQAGVEFQPGREVTSFDGAFVFGDGRRSPRFDLSIDALGVRSPLRTAPGGTLAYGALWANLDLTPAFDAAALEQRYERARKMAGVLPIGLGRAAFFWSLKGADYEAWRARPLEAWKDEARMLWPTTGALLDQIQDHDALVFARYAHGTMASPLSRGLVHLGDSAHCASPQLGQGANMALLDALALARAVRASGDDMEAAGALYARMRRWHIRLYQAASFAFTPAYQSDLAAASFVRDWIMSPISRIWPVPQLLAALVAGQVGAPLAAIKRLSETS